LVLPSKGLVETDDKETADVAVFVSYKLGEPIESDAPPLPPPITNANGTPFRDGMIQGPGGAYPRHGDIMVPKLLHLSALRYAEYRKTKKRNYYWRADATLTEKGDDLRRALPILVAGISSYLGKSVEGDVWVNIAENDPKLLVLTGSKQ